MHRHTYPEVRRLLATCPPPPRGEGPQMGLEIVSSMRQIFGALIGCCSNCPLTFYPKRPRHLRLREISYQVLVGPKDSPGLIYAAGSIPEPIGRKNTFMATDILGFSWYFCCDIYCFIPFHKCCMHRALGRIRPGFDQNIWE